MVSSDYYLDPKTGKSYPYVYGATPPCDPKTGKPFPLISQIEEQHKIDSTLTSWGQPTVASFTTPVTTTTPAESITTLSTVAKTPTSNSSMIIPLIVVIVAVGVFMKR